MPLLVAVLAASVALAPPFGEASASAVTIQGGLRISVQVVVESVPSPDVVVVHLLVPGGQETYPLAATGPSTFASTFDLPAANAVAVFEAAWGADRYEVSEPVTLATLGVPHDLLGIPAPASNGPPGGSLPAPLVPAALAVLALVLGAVAALGLGPGSDGPRPDGRRGSGTGPPAPPGR